MALQDGPPVRLLGRPHVVLLGSNRVAGQIRRALENEDVEIVPCKSVERAEAALADSTSAVIVVPPINGSALVSTCARFTRGESNIPVFVACGPISVKTIKELYDAGVAAVFSWPLDRDPLVRTVFRISRRTQPSRTKRSSGEIALEELVSAHLGTAEFSIGRRLRVRVVKRYVMLAGHVDALWQVRVAENIAAEVPGVDDVFSDSVLVTRNSELSDSAIANSVRQVLKHTSSVDSSTLAATVNDGEVTLAGSVTSRNELERVLDLISHARGVVKIHDWVVVSARGQKEDHQLVQVVHKAVALRFPRAKIDVAVIGGVAILSGKVRTSAERRELCVFVSHQSGIRRVVDKLRVAGARRAN